MIYIIILKKNKYKIDIYDPVVNRLEANELYNIELISYPIKRKYAGIIIAVKHKNFIKMNVKTLKSFGVKHSVLFDVKNILPKNVSTLRL